jgi:hypothetical protein
MELVPPNPPIAIAISRGPVPGPTHIARYERARVKIYEIEPTFGPLAKNDSTNEIARDNEENVNSDESRSERKQAGVEKYHARDSDCSQPVDVWAIARLLR